MMAGCEDSGSGVSKEYLGIPMQRDKCTSLRNVKTLKLKKYYLVLIVFF